MTIEVRVKPKSSKEGVKDLGGGKFEVRVKEPPEEGRANKRLIELISDYFNVPIKSVKIKHGQNSRNKIVVIEGL